MTSIEFLNHLATVISLLALGWLTLGFLGFALEIFRRRNTNNLGSYHEKQKSVDGWETKE